MIAKGRSTIAKQWPLLAVVLLALPMTGCTIPRPVGAWTEGGTVVIGFRGGMCSPGGPTETEIEYVDLYSPDPRDSLSGDPQPIWRAFRNPGGAYRSDFPITLTIEGYTIITDLKFPLRPNRDYYVSASNRLGGSLKFRPAQLRDDAVYLGVWSKRDEYQSKDDFNSNPRGCVAEERRIQVLTGALTVAGGLTIAVGIAALAFVTRRINRRNATVRLMK